MTGSALHPFPVGSLARGALAAPRLLRRAAPEARAVPLPPVAAWRIHIGAHKTATTHLQHTLEAIRPRLAAAGLDCLPLAALRQSGFARALRQPPLAARLPGLGPALARRRAEALLAPWRTGPPVLLISEEKLLGCARHVFADPPYPLIETVLPRLAALGAPVTLFLSIRSFATQLASAYAQELRVLPPPEGGFAAILARVRARPPSWFDIVGRIRRAAPGLALRIWRQEDYPRHRPAIVAALCGCAPGPLPELPVPLSTKSPALEGVRAAEALPRALPPARRRALVAALYAAHQEGPRFAPFAPAEARALAAAYEADVMAIARMWPEAMILPERAAAA